MAGTVIAVSGCCRRGGPGGNGGSGGLVGVDARPVATPDPVDFGTVGTGTTHSIGLVISNSGTGILNVQSAAASGDSSYQVSTVKDVTLEAAGKFTVNVRFTPQTDGPHDGQLTVSSDSPDLPTLVIPLKGVAFSFKVQVVPSELDFGEVQVGTQSQARTVTVTNTAAAAETIGVGPLGGLSAAEFSASPTGSQANVAAGKSISVAVTFAPKSPSADGQNEQATLPVTACDGCAPVDVALTGRGVDTELVFDPPYVSFPSVPQGTTATQLVFVEAISTPHDAKSPIVATLTAPPALVSPATPGLTVSPADQSGNPATWPGSLSPPGGTYFLVTYAPGTGAPSSANDLVDVAYTDGTVVKPPAQLPVSLGEAGSPCQSIVANPTSVNFGTVLAGKTSSKTVVLTNNGPQLCNLTNLEINPNDQFDEFGLTGGTIPQLALAPGKSQTLTVTFAPQKNTPPLMRRAMLTMQTSDQTVPSINVPLTGLMQNAYYANSAWPKWHHDNANSGLSPADTSANAGKLAWKMNIGKPVGLSGEFATYIHSPVIGKDPNPPGDDIVYMLGYGDWNPSPKRGQAGSGAGQFIAFDGPSGTQLWSTPMTGPEASAQESTPTIVADNSIFLMTGGEQSYYPQFYHIGPNGSILWSGVQAIGGATFPCNFDASGATDCSKAGGTTSINDGFDTCPGFDNSGILYLFDDDQPGCDTYSSTASAANGGPTLQWSATDTMAKAHIESFSGALTDQSQSVFSWGGYVISFDAKGTELWSVANGNGLMTDGWAAKKSNACENDSKGSPAISGDGTEAVVAFGGYLTSCTSGGGYGSSGGGSAPSGNLTGGIVGINLQKGTVDWGWQWNSVPPPPAPYNNNGSYPSALVAYSSPASLGDGGWVMGWVDGIYAFDPPAPGTTPPAATIRWHVPAGLVLSSPAVGNDGTVFVGSTDGNFYAIDGVHGTVKWTYPVGAAINSSPAIGSDGSVYFTADDGNLYALR